MKRYEPKGYWEERLNKDFSLGGVGYLGLGLEYNKWLYKARLRTLSQLLRRIKMDVRGKRVLELGVGNGFYVEYWKKMRASSVTGVDITEKSISSLETRYPEYEFMQADISSKGLPIQGTFDLITAFDVLFHIVDEDKFEQALANLADLCHQDTAILVMDSFLKENRPPRFHQYNRTMDRYKEALSKAGMKAVVIMPVFYLMSNPIDIASVENRFIKRIAPLAWLGIRKLCGLGNKLGLLGRAVNYALGFTLYLADGAVLRLAKGGPGTKLLLARPGE